MATKPSLHDDSDRAICRSFAAIAGRRVRRRAGARSAGPNSIRWIAATLERYLAWDLQHYTRNLIDHTDLYDLMAICWEIGQVSSIHNHKGQNCWMSVPVGRLVVQNYRVIFESVEEHRCEIVPIDSVEMNAQRPVGVNPEHPVHSVCESARVQPASGEPAHLLAALRFLRGVFRRAGNLRRDPAALHHQIRGAPPIRGT